MNFHAQQAYCPDEAEMWRAAVALNNIAAYLFQRHCYEQGLQTIIDAAHVMKALSALSESCQDPAALAAFAQDVHFRLQRANHCLSDPHSSNDFIDVVVLTEDDIESTLEISPSSDSLVLIRVEKDIGTEQNSESLSSDEVLTAAIILHNCGIAHLGVSRIRNDANQLSRGLSLLQLADRCLAPCCEPALQCSEDSVLILLLQIIISQAMVQGLLESGQRDEADKFLSAFHSLRGNVQQMDEYFYGHNRAAAAA